MAEAAPDPTVAESINNELRQHYQRLVDAYRPDLKEDLPPGEPIFHTLNPCHLNEQRELDRREIRVQDLLQEGENELPRRLLLLGRPESGKTALFALILHHWLHDDKSWIKGLKDFDFLLAVQCLGLESLSSSGQTSVDLEKHMLDHLPSSVEKYGEEVVRQTMRKAKVLVMIDSLDFLDSKNTLDEKTSLAPWSDRRVLLFCRYKFMKDNREHVFFSEQSKDNLVLKLWGGMTPNLFEIPQNTHENIAELGGVFSEKLWEDYCKRLSKCNKKDESKFKNYYRTTLKYLAMDMRKPLNIYLAMKAFCNDENFDVKTQSQLYGKWLEIWSKSYRTSFHKSELDSADTTVKGITFLKKLAYKAFTTENEYISHEQIQEHDELVDLLSHFLMPHYNPHGKVQHFTFRIAAHRFVLAAEQMITEMIYGTRDMKAIVCDAECKKLEPVLPMILGGARGREFYDRLKDHCKKIAEMNWTDHMTQQFHDPIINYVVTILSETKQFSDKHDQPDPFIAQIIKGLPQKNWCIVDGNMHPEALRALCECGQDKDNRNNSKPQRLNILLEGSPNDMPGLEDILRAVEDCDIRINLSSDRSFLDEEGKLSLDNAALGLHGTGKASLASLTGYLKEVKKLDAHPATRRTYKVGLRICSINEYEQLREMCKSSHKLNQVMLRISSKDKTALVDSKKLKELPTNISNLTIYLEGFSDEDVDTAISIWRSIQGKAKRKVRNLRFWDILERKLSPNSVKKIIEANLLATRIEVPLEQPVSKYDKDELQNELNKLKEDKYIILLKGSSQYPREDMRKNN